MNWILDMATRNVKRNKRRTALAVASICLTVMLMTFLGGFVDGVLDNMVRNLTRNETGHVRITTKGFETRARFMPVDELIADPGAVVRAIEAIPGLPGGLVVASERLLFGTLLSNGPNTKAAVGLAGDARNETGLINLDRSIVQGTYLAAPGEAILGAKLARDLGFGVGDTLRVVTQGSDYGLHLKRFTVSGIFDTGLNQLDGSFFQVHLDDAQALLRSGGASQQLLVMLEDYRKADEAAEAIRHAIAALPGGDGLVVRSWTEIGDYPRMIGMMEGIYEWVFVVVAFLGAFIITNILMMVVLERRKEIGILKAMGLRRRDVMAMFLAEGALMGAVGSALGAVLGLGLCYVFSIYGMDFSEAMGSLTFPVDPVFYARFDLLVGLKMFLLGLAVSVVVSITPSRKAATMNAVDAIKSVA